MYEVIALVLYWICLPSSPSSAVRWDLPPPYSLFNGLFLWGGLGIIALDLFAVPFFSTSFLFMFLVSSAGSMGNEQSFVTRGCSFAMCGAATQEGLRILLGASFLSIVVALPCCFAFAM